VALIRASISVIDNDAPVPIPVCNEHFIGLGIHRDPRRPVQIGSIVAAIGHSVFADLQQKLPGLREFKDLRILAAVTANPDVVLVINEDAVFHVGPFVAGPGPAPCLYQVPGHIEFDDRRRGDTAIRLRRNIGRELVIVLKAARPVRDPDVVVGIDKDSPLPPSIHLFGRGFGQ